MSILSKKFNFLILSSLLLFSINSHAKTRFWKIDKCRVYGISANITLSTDASISHNKIHFRLVSDVPLKDAPELQLNTAKFTGFDLEGSGRGFGFEVEYSPIQVSYLLHPNATLVAEYEPIYKEFDGNYYTYHAAFPMQELPELISKVSKTCHTFKISSK